MFLGLLVGLGVHLVATCGATNLPLLHASEGGLKVVPEKEISIIVFLAASRNWVQRVLSDVGHTVCSFSPSLGRILLTRLNPITLLVIGGAASLAMTQILIDLE